MFAKVKQFFGFVLPGIIKPLRVLWNQIIGFVFICLAIWAIPSTIKAIREFEGDADSLFRIILAGLFSVFMIWFGATSFLRARKIDRKS